MFHSLTTTLGVLLLLLISNISYSQTAHQDLQSDFNPITCKGEIPEFLLVSLEERIQKFQEAFQTDDLKRKKRKDVEESILAHNRWLIDYINSGNLVFGDTISAYLNTLKDELLKDDEELRNKIEIYVNKSPSVNAFAVPSGLIVVNIGVLSRVKNEAQLAYLLLHEIAHVKKEHGLNKISETSDIIRGKGKYQNLSHYKRMNMLTSRSKEQELEADGYAFQMFKNLGYDNKESIGLLEMLQFEYYPFEEKPLDRATVSINNHVIPEDYFLSEVQEVNPDDAYFDEFSSHPNTRTRKDQLYSLIELDQSKSTIKYKLQVSDFEYIRDLSRFELIRQELVNREYSSVLYHVSILESKYPNNKFLKISKAKSWYSLAAYKITPSIASSRIGLDGYTDIQGYSQEMFYLVKSLTDKQLSTIALKFLIETKKLYPNEPYWDIYINNLTKKMVVDLGFSADEYAKGYKQGKLPENILEYDPRDQQKLKQVSNRNFYRQYFSEESNSTEFVQLFEQHNHYRDSLILVDKLTHKERTKLEDKKEKEIQKNGPGIHAKSVLYLEPRVSIDLDRNSDDTKEDEWTFEFINEIENSTKEQGIEYYMAVSSELQQSEVEKYNYISHFKEWLVEVSLASYYDIIPTNTFVYEMGVNKKGLNHLAFVSYNANTNSRNYYYVFRLYNLTTAELEYSNRESFNANASKGTIKSLIEDDINQITK